ncbi:uncharacterized protein LOC109196971 [Oreochromis niloticus]|uniref:uncharacterized protein LOC109196971 n=1 Tax=Oreochromis niloticus TaxID=8128 RepID=UPI000905C10C|nr:uncharacterized protein LOC109196971 [Oreochromis niloticus]
METMKTLLKVYLLLLIGPPFTLEQSVVQYITELQVSLDEAEETYLSSQGFIKIDVDLNKGAEGKYIYLWYKKGSSSPITRIQLTFNDGMSRGLITAGYQKINKNLNAGTSGDYIYLWYYRGNSEYDVPIVDLHVSIGAREEAQMFAFGWERLACDLNRKARGKWIYLWVKRERPTNGYIRVDEDTNRGAGGSFVFIWYRQTTNSQRAITDLKISTDDIDEMLFQYMGFTRVTTDLSKGAGGSYVYLWYKKDSGLPIRAVSVIVNTAAVEQYRYPRVFIRQNNLNSGNNGNTLYLSFSSF